MRPEGVSQSLCFPPAGGVVVQRCCFKQRLVQKGDFSFPLPSSLLIKQFRCDAGENRELKDSREALVCSPCPHIRMLSPLHSELGGKREVAAGSSQAPPTGGG